MSPIVDVTYSRTQAEEKCFDILIQDVRINLSVPFLMHLGRYFLDSLPNEQIEKGIINHGYNDTVKIIQIISLLGIFLIFCIKTLSFLYTSISQKYLLNINNRINFLNLFIYFNQEPECFKRRN